MSQSPHEPLIEQYWQRYLDTLPQERRGDSNYLVDQFGDIPELANELGQLVLDGLKTATCSALWEWEAEGQPFPKSGLKSIVLNGDQQPICIIETTEVTFCPFNQVKAEFAYDEGEGDRTLDYWRRAHWNYFSRVLPKIGKEPTPDMMLVCERFRVVFRSPQLGFTIRDCREEEAEAVLTLWRDAEATVSPTDQLDSVQMAIAARSTHFLIAEQHGQIVGSIIGGFDGWRGTMYRLVVHPKAQRNGIATALVQEVEHRFVQQGAKRISALVEREHSDAVSFWPSVGYEKDSRIDRYIHNL